MTSYMLSWRRKLSKSDLNIKELDQVGANSFFYELNPTEKGCNMKINIGSNLKVPKNLPLQNCKTKCFAQAISNGKFKEQKINSVNSDKVAYYELPYLALHCLKVNISFLALSELRGL